jgi:undecaprenyl-diphosphatase
MLVLVWKAVVMGIVEGLTEFLPISSTGHLILTGAAIDYPEAGRVTLEIFIQLGAILAVLWHYAHDLRALVARAPHDPTARDLVLKVFAAFVPAAVFGLLFHHAIEERLFSPAVVATTLVLGGLVILVIERRPRRPRTTTLEGVTWREAVLVGLAQVLSLVPGVSRAGATIIGGVVFGLSRPVSTQFSFYLALPTVGAASIYALLKGLHALSAADVVPLTVGFVAAFASALVVIRAFLAWVRTHDFRAFGWYRIALGIVVYLVLAEHG